MSTKQVVFDADLRRQLTTGIDPIANAVKVTLISGGVVWASRNPAARTLNVAHCRAIPAIIWSQPCASVSS